jgi:hypothetical protein
MAKNRLVIWPDFIWSFGQNSFGHLARHFLPLLLNGERKWGKDLEMTGKCPL